MVEETNFYSSSTASYQSKTSFLEAVIGVRDGGKSKKKSQLKYVEEKRKKIKQKSKGVFQDNLERGHSRAMARARARERVREKMRIRKLDDELMTVVHDDFDYQVTPLNLTFFKLYNDKTITIKDVIIERTLEHKISLKSKHIKI